MPKQYYATPLAAAAGGADIASIPFVETTFLERWTATVILTVSAATLQAVLRIMGSNVPGAIGALTAADQQALSTLAAITALPAGITITSAGIVLNNPAVATHVFGVSLGAPLPLAIRPDYDWTSGGGTVALTMNLNAYGLNS